ncbi:hypothetical protein ARMSODRAFT_1089955 [Armillaria solidipes]|uniref:Uncharacterized protein n=1 Tax=Armillaria solidipes TaxID=1076256 RepID=A0A2H3AQ64_9AGAR|nr:hypothetical protein ARMSODRAFT_1089955 [Armillaria solidipes]
MADVTLGLVTSVTALIQNIATAIGYVKDVKNAPKEIAQFLKELKYLKLYLSNVEELIPLSTENDPWLETLKQLFDPPDDAPDSLFTGLTEPIKELDKKLKMAPPQWKIMEKRLVWTSTKTSVVEDLQKIERFKTLMMSAVQLDAIKLSHAIKGMVAHLEDTVADVKGTVDVLFQKTEQVQMDKADAKMAEWLTSGSVDYKEIQKEKLEERTSGTGRQFLTSPVFRNWKDGPSPTRLWCPGQPGAGKSVLASIIVKDLETSVSPRKALVLCIFCDYQKAATIRTIVCSLLKQTIQSQGLSSHSKSVYVKESANGTQPSVDTLSDTLSKALGSYGGRVYIVLDALDEFTDTDGGRRRLIDTLKSLAGDDIRLLVTSRDIATIELLFEIDTRLDIRAADEDINKFVMKRLSQDDLANLIRGRNDLHEEILTGVVKKADGMFLLATLHVNLLAQTINPGTLREALGKLPTTIHDMYDKTLTERVDTQGEYKKKLAEDIFGWVAFARRPLTVLELQHALAVDLDRMAFHPDYLCDVNILGNVCAGLVVTDRTYGTMRFVHYTVQEYFMSEEVSRRLKFSCIQEKITRTCLTYMGNPAIPEFLLLSQEHSLLCSMPLKPWRPIPRGSDALKLILERNPFLAYSSIFWVHHARGAVECSMEDEIIAFLDVAHHRQVAVTFSQATLNADPPYTVLSALHFAVRYDLVDIMEALLNRGKADPHEASALIIAAREGRLEAVKRLLFRGDVDVNQADSKTGRTPLMEAADLPAGRLSQEVVKAILNSEHMCSLNSVDKHGESALFRPMYGNSEGVFEILLETTGVNATLNNKEGDSPLAIAICHDRSDMIKMLLERKDVDPDAQSPLSQWTPLFHAAKAGDPSVTEMLLQPTRQVNMKGRDHNGCTALMVAALYGNAPAIKLLLAGIDIMAKDNSGMTAYSHACRRICSSADYGEVISLLEEHGGRPMAIADSLPNSWIWKMAVPSRKPKDS